MSILPSHVISTDRVDLVRVVNEIGIVMVVVFVVETVTSVVVGVVLKWVVGKSVDKVGDVVFRIDVLIVDEVSSGTVVSVIV